MLKSTTKIARADVVNEVIRIAFTQKGVKEIRNTNRGKTVRLYQDATDHGGTGWPWCAAFVSWCLRQAAKKLGLETFDFIYSASCDLMLFWARKLGIANRKPRRGDVFLCMASKNDATHTGLVAEVLGGTKFKTVEGNTNNDGSANGDGVYVRERDYEEEEYIFVSWWELLSIPAEAPAMPWILIVGEKRTTLMKAGQVTYAPTRWLGETALGLPVTWHPLTQTVSIGKTHLTMQLKFDENGDSYAPTRAMLEALKFDAVPDMQARTVTAKRRPTAQ